DGGDLPLAGVAVAALRRDAGRLRREGHEGARRPPHRRGGREAARRRGRLGDLARPVRDDGDAGGVRGLPHDPRVRAAGLTLTSPRGPRPVAPLRVRPASVVWETLSAWGRS